MKLEFDPAKSERNARQRGLSFESVKEFDFESAQIAEETTGETTAKFDSARSDRWAA